MRPREKLRANPLKACGKGNPKKQGKGKRQGKNDGRGSKNRGKEKGKNGQVAVQQQVEGWTNYFRTASERKIRQAIESEKCQVLPDDVKQKIKMAADKFLSQKDE